jgi:hypothetical protein
MTPRMDLQAYRLISTNFGMVLDVPLDVFSPNDWVIVV